MKRFSLLLLFACFLVISGRASAQTLTPNDVIGKWINQLGSTLNITAIDPKTGQITGTYISPSGGGDKEFPLIGWVNSRPPVKDKDNVVVMSFSVRWGDIGSITAWSGYLREVNGVRTIAAQWFLARPNSDFKWDHILTNQDVFTPKKEVAQRKTPRRISKRQLSKR